MLFGSSVKVLIERSLLVTMCIWLFLQAYLLTAITSLWVSFIVIAASAVIATWGVGRILSLLKRSLRSEDLTWVNNFHQRLLPAATFAALVLMFISFDVLFAWLRAEQITVTAQRVMCVVQSKAPAKISVERALVDGHGCFALTSQPSQPIRIQLSYVESQIQIGHKVDIALVSGASLVVGQDVYIFDASIERVHAFGHSPR
jgi:hypothetical protein